MTQTESTVTAGTPVVEVKEIARREFKYRRPWLYEKQLSAMFNPLDLDNNPARYSMIEATTKAGKTVSALVWLGEQALLNGGPGRNFWWIAPVYAQTKIAFRRFVRSFRKWPFAIYHVDNQELTVTLFNGSVLWWKSGEKPDNLYGEDVWAAVIDEASRVREEAWHAVRSTLTATRGPLRAIGNVKGRKNWFFRMARRAEAGAPGMAYYKLTAHDAVEAGIMDKAEMEDAKSVLPESVFNELYLAIPSDDESNPFGLEHIRACIMPELSDARTRAAGVDLARKKNWSVIIGVDRDCFMTGIERFRESWARQEERINEIIKHIPTLIDATGPGDVMFERLAGKNEGTADPFIFTNKSKQLLMEGLAVAFQSGQVKIIGHGVAGKALVDELENFEFQHSGRGNVIYGAPEGMDDDCVVALALAVEKWRRTMPTAGLKNDSTDLTSVSAWLGEEAEGDDGQGPTET